MVDADYEPVDVTPLLVDEVFDERVYLAIGEGYSFMTKGVMRVGRVMCLVRVCVLWGEEPVVPCAGHFPSCLYCRCGGWRGVWRWPSGCVCVACEVGAVYAFAFTGSWAQELFGGLECPCLYEAAHSGWCFEEC